MWNAEFVYQTACQLAQIALEQQSQLTTELKPDNSVVTQADRMVEQAAIETLSDPDNQIYLIGEETVKEFSEAQLKQALASRCYVLDPIDGTVPYSSVIPSWGISIGYAVEGKVSEGCIVLPAIHQVILTQNGKVYFGQGKNGLPDFSELQEVSPTSKEHCLAPSRVLSISQNVAKGKNLQKLTRGVNCFYSVVLPFVYLAMGRMAGIYANFNVWDGAAGFAILRNLGFNLAFEDGEMISLELEKDFDFSKYQSGNIPSRKPFLLTPSKEFHQDVMACVV